MSDITRVITLGIGPVSDIPGFVLLGLNTGVVTPTVKGSATITDASLYSMVLADALVSGLSLTDAGQTGYNGIVLEIGTGYWLFEDGTIISWFTGLAGLAVSDD